MYTSTLLILLLIAFATASTGHHKVNSTRTAPSNRYVTAKTSARSDYPHHGYEHHYPHHYGGGGHLGFGHHKDFDHYLLPMLLVLGLGVLCMPLIGVLMSTMVGNVPVTTLVSGRRKRDISSQLISEKTILRLWKKVGKAIEVFTKDD